MEYRRSRQEGGTSFFTVSLVERSGTLLVDRIDDLRNAVRAVKQRHPVDILAWTVLPDQRHVDYVHINPAKHGDVARAVDWPYSSIHR